MTDTLLQFLGTVSWQSTLVLGIALVGSHLVRRHPARAHAVLAAGLIAAVVAPMMTFAVRAGGLGVLPPPSPAETIETSASIASSALPVSPSDEVNSVDVLIPDNAQVEHIGPLVTDGRSGADGGSVTSAPTGPNTHIALTESHVWWREIPLVLWLVAGWCALSIGVLLWLARQVVCEIRLLRSSEPAEDERLLSLASWAANQLGIAHTVEVRLAENRYGPAIWCFAKRPIVLITPECVADCNDDDLKGIFLHELAHCRRRDHVWQLLGTVVACLLPWHPLVWIVRGRMRAAGEAACDALVIRAGARRDTYANLLLRLVTAQRAQLISAAGGSRRRLERRIRAILGGTQAHALIGRSWQAGLMTSCALSILMLAAAQPGALPVVPTHKADSAQDVPASQPDRHTNYRVISTDEMRAYLLQLRAAIEKHQIDYVWKDYHGYGAPPDAEPNKSLLRRHHRRSVVMDGARFRQVLDIVASKYPFPSEPGLQVHKTWDGFEQRRRRVHNMDLPDEAYINGRPDHARTGAVSNLNSQFAGSMNPEMMWLNIACPAFGWYGGWSDRDVHLAQIFDHPSLRGPFLLHDGRTEWQVHDPSTWNISSDDGEAQRWIHVIAERAPPDNTIRLAEIRQELSADFETSGQTRVKHTIIFSSDVFSPQLPQPRHVVHTDMTTWVGQEPFWTRTHIDLIDITPAAIDETTFRLVFEDGDYVFDQRYQIGYTVGGDTIALPREKEGLIRTHEPVRGDVGPNLAHWVEHGALIDPGPRRRYESITTPDLELLPSHKHDLGEAENMNWGSGIFHVFTVTNESNKPVTITKIEPTGDAMTNVWLGYNSPEERGHNRVPSGVTGEGTTLQAGESAQMYVGMQIGVGLWRHAVILHTGSGEQWTYQLSATGTFEPVAALFIRSAPRRKSRRLEAGVRLWTTDPETDPIEIVDPPPGVTIEFDEWITLTPMHFMGASPMQQISHFTLDLSHYEGDWPTRLNLQTARGVPLTMSIKD